MTLPSPHYSSWLGGVSRSFYCLSHISHITIHRRHGKYYHNGCDRPSDVFRQIRQNHGGRAKARRTPTGRGGTNIRTRWRRKVLRRRNMRRMRRWHRRISLSSKTCRQSRNRTKYKTVPHQPRGQGLEKMFCLCPYKTRKPLISRHTTTCYRRIWTRRPRQRLRRQYLTFLHSPWKSLRSQWTAHTSMAPRIMTKTMKRTSETISLGQCFLLRALHSVRINPRARYHLHYRILHLV